MTRVGVQNAIVQIDATPFKLYYIKHYGLSKDFFNQGKVFNLKLLFRARYKYNARLIGRTFSLS